MKTIILPLTLGVISLFTGLGASASAQSTNPQNPQNPQNSIGAFQKNEVGSNEDSAFGSPLDLIHNMNMRRGRDSGEFAEDSKTNLNQAADEFKRLQQQRLQNQSSDSNVIPQN
ncbi:hypothetical protein PCC7424_4874 [Gloeothece citriformis PCC 7424]|uniref:Low temperature-induced protein n=1 Tax=Gloeothece citriformis (strain PCC 7424) TaxID=65393 RepID=B7KEB3_GLOC7|nr:hypothetical protein [Gloeothece citriformis]ACK73231.1 hypothetical protein PCC7424_4874 [Gloeothece citriformis PCC 7424]